MNQQGLETFSQLVIERDDGSVNLFYTTYTFCLILKLIILLHIQVLYKWYIYYGNPLIKFYLIILKVFSLKKIN